MKIAAEKRAAEGDAGAYAAVAAARSIYAAAFTRAAILAMVARLQSVAS
jgi:hypothetical protein